MLEYDNSAFYYFTLSLISIYLLPVTLVSLKQVRGNRTCKMDIAAHKARANSFSVIALAIVAALAIVVAHAPV